MAPEYGATCGFFPVDSQTIKYLKDTGRNDELVELVQKYTIENKFYYNEEIEPEYSTALEFDISKVVS